MISKTQTTEESSQSQRTSANFCNLWLSRVAGMCTKKYFSSWANRRTLSHQSSRATDKTITRRVHLQLTALVGREEGIFISFFLPSIKLKGREIETEKETPVCQFNPQMPKKARAGPGPKLEAGTHFQVSRRGGRNLHQAPLPPPPRICSSSKLDSDGSCHCTPGTLMSLCVSPTRLNAHVKKDILSLVFFVWFVGFGLL